MRCLSVLDLVILFYLFIFFPWPRSSKGPRMGFQFFKNADFSVRSSKGPRMGRQFFKNVDFSVTYPLKGV